jgi:hypothetical protein
VCGAAASPSGARARRERKTRPSLVTLRLSNYGQFTP